MTVYKGITWSPVNKGLTTGHYLPSLAQVLRRRATKVAAWKPGHQVPSERLGATLRGYRTGLNFKPESSVVLSVNLYGLFHFLATIIKPYGKYHAFSC